ncbi:MAG TPA: VanZ family protein [Bryobacteraceae bacterium]|nr:VanZ family protein [Bryobacteraceae bacterium]
MQTRHFRGLLAAVVILIVYGSLYPFRFTLAGHYGNFWALPGRTDVFDVVFNLFLYTPIGFLAFHSLESTSRGRRIAVAAAFGFAMSTVIELLQGLVVSRGAGFSDIVCNGCGALGGALFAAAWHHGVRPGSRYAPRTRAFRPAFVLVFWAVFQLYPLIPHPHFSLARERPGVMTLLFAVDWLAALVLLSEVLAPKDRALAALAIWAAPVKAFLMGRSLTLAELAAAAMAVVAFLACLRRPALAGRILPAILIAAMVGRELWPFHFGAGAAFHWVPFSASLGVPMQPALLVLAQKAFMYGSVIWVCDRSGRHARGAAAAVAVLVFLLEWLQQFIPGRTPDITDVALVALIGSALVFLPGGEGAAPQANATPVLSTV